MKFSYLTNKSNFEWSMKERSYFYMSSKGIADEAKDKTNKFHKHMTSGFIP